MNSTQSRTRSDNEDVNEFVDENIDFIVQVLKHSNDTYARACALVLLSRCSDVRKLDEIQRDLEQVN